VLSGELSTTPPSQMLAIIIRTDGKRPESQSRRAAPGQSPDRNIPQLAGVIVGARTASGTRSCSKFGHADQSSGALDQASHVVLRHHAQLVAAQPGDDHAQGVGLEYGRGWRDARPRAASLFPERMDRRRLRSLQRTDARAYQRDRRLDACLEEGCSTRLGGPLGAASAQHPRAPSGSKHSLG